ncbi:hypothetical protein [Clostridium perfringens]|nr:hypothetical protein [Clostridium perfringens]
MTEYTRKVVELANVYIEKGETFTQAIKKAEEEIRNQEIEKYEK